MLFFISAVVILGRKDDQFQRRNRQRHIMFFFFYADHISSYSLGFLVVTTSPSRQVRISLMSLKDRIQKQEHHPFFVLLMLHPLEERFEQKEEEEDNEEVGVSDISPLLPFPVFVITPPADPVSKLIDTLFH